MKITIIARQMEISDRQKKMVEKKLSTLNKYFYDEGNATVTFSNKRNKKNIELTISANNTLFRCENEDETFANALDRSIDAIDRQIRKNKTRLAKRLRDGAFNDSYDFDDDDYEEEPEYKIRVKEFAFKPMSVEEAILQMNLLDHQFFVFEDDKTGDTCVVYAKKDGSYGLIVPSK